MPSGPRVGVATSGKSGGGGGRVLFTTVPGVPISTDTDSYVVGFSHVQSEGARPPPVG